MAEETERRIDRAAKVGLFTARPFRMLAHLALPLVIVLTGALAYRLAVFPALIARGPEASGFDLLVLVGDWLLFGPSYGLVGAAAPLAVLLLLLRRRRSSLGLAALLHGVALVGAALAFALGRFRANIGMLGPVPDNMAVFHPLFAAPKVDLWPINGVEMLVSVLALYLIMRPHVRRLYRFPKPDGPGAAVIAFGLVIVQLALLRAGSRVARALSERAAGDDVAAAAIAKLLAAASRTRAAFARLRAIPPFRRLAQLAMLLAFVLAVAISGWPQPQP